MDNISTRNVRKGRFGEPTLFLLEARKEGMNCAEREYELCGRRVRIVRKKT